jgi:hypothetical protein
MIAIRHFRELIIRPALDALQLYSVNREQLLVITCAQESLGGEFLMQNDAAGWPKGPALGPYQMEPNTYYDFFDNFLKYRTILHGRLMNVVGSSVLHTPSPNIMVYNLRYATAVACLQYYRFREAVPADLEGQLRYYKLYWNTILGKATIAEARKNYYRWVNG